jgi:hypothetical protein
MRNLFPVNGVQTAVLPAAVQEYQTFYNGMGGWRWGGFGETTTQVQSYPVGSLVLDFYDTRNKQLVWRAVTSDMLSDKPVVSLKFLNPWIGLLDVRGI